MARKKNETATTLTKAEEQVMQAVWNLGKGFAGEIAEAVEEPKPAYRTVLTEIRILEQKGFVGHQELGGNNQYPDRRLVACMELHTFSSLTQEFLQQYAHSMDEADVRYVYFSQHALQLKKLPPLDPEEVRKAFGGNVEVFTDSAAMVAKVKAMEWKNANLLMMSSGNFDGIDFNQLAEEVLG